jgi:hypothetical protein
MQLEVQHPAFIVQRLSVETAGWLRGPQLVLNGTVVKKQNGRYTVVADSGAETSIQLRYNYLDPVPKLAIGDEIIELAKSLTWYEYVWLGIPFVLVVSGGGLGGLVGLVAAHANGRVFRSERSSPAKYGWSALVTLASFGAFVALVSLIQSFSGLPHE